MRDRNKALLAKIETTPGTEETPDSSNYIPTENLRFEPNVNLIQTNENTGSLDSAAPIAGGMRGRLTFDVQVRGSGTPGTPPAFGPLLRACSWAETETDTAVPASAEACAAGSTTSATLAAGASATAQAYRGMPILISGAVTAANGMHFISNYSSGKVATLADLAGGAISASSDYQIPINVRYSPTSDATAIKALTLFFYKDGKLIKLLGARGNARLRMEAGGIARWSFDFTGIFAGETDAAVPSDLADPTTVAPVWRGGKALLQRAEIAIDTLEFDTGASPVLGGNPNEAEGFDIAEITTRDMTGSIDPNDVLVATRDTMADFRNGTQRIVLAQWGTVAGNRFALIIPAAQYTSLSDQERQGIAKRALGFKATGRDAGAFLACY